MIYCSTHYKVDAALSESLIQKKKIKKYLAHLNCQQQVQQTWVGGVKATASDKKKKQLNEQLLHQKKKKLCQNVQ